MTAADIAIHIAAACGAVMLGAFILYRPKGTARHKLLGRIWVIVMIVVAAGSFRLHGLREGLSPIHGLSIFTLASLAYAIYSIRNGRTRAHKQGMIGVFIGLVAAGALTLLPGRIIGNFIFGG